MIQPIEFGRTEPKAACACGGHGDHHASEPAAADAQEILVTGMTCAHCVSAVTQELTAIDGVTDVSVDLQAGGTSRVTFRAASPVDSQAIAAAIDEAGYSLA
ncbi:heavy-metal-associated domain-containing protein [Microbacterium sp. SORGH_AS_0862]|uniref:heavy-metal-associated domain-containing protein n=1 Tax=Microbacterium sp. SORGH_AS_0862 TaxID=3041789 RepID=UPI00278FC674|nr:cation transporter [Microbacterium sp. SORGH_AS_0862]MDQ1205451.1 copper chaperone [Microbacterium sp. SORGH_AS_0862]